MRKLAAEPFDHGAGACVEVAGAGVVAEARPFDEHGLEVRGGQRLDRGPQREEALVVFADGRNGRLLQHDLAQPDAIGIGMNTAGAIGWRDAPGQRPRMPVVPLEDGGAVERGGLSRVVGIWHDDGMTRPAGRCN